MKDLWHQDQAEIHTVPLTLEALSSGSAPELLDCFRDFFFVFWVFAQTDSWFVEFFRGLKDSFLIGQLEPISSHHLCVRRCCWDIS